MQLLAKVNLSKTHISKDHVRQKHPKKHILEKNSSVQMISLAVL